MTDDYWQANIWDAQTGQHMQTVEDPELGNIAQLVLSADGGRLALGESGYVRVFETSTGKPLGPALGLDTSDAVRRLKFSPDGTRLMIAAEARRSGIDSPMTGVWDIATGLRMLPIPCNEAIAGDFSSDGKRVAISFKDGETGATTVWDVPPEVPETAIEAAKPRATIPGELPARGDKDRLIPLQHLEVRNDLPHDLPLPAVTPFDDSPEGRRDYHRGYRLGFVVGLLDEGTPDDLDDREPPAFLRGMKDGETDGYKLYSLRHKSDWVRRTGYRKGPRAHLVTEASPEPEQAVLRRFNAFARDFERAIRGAFPDTVAIDVPGVPRLYRYEYDDYSRDNTRQPHPVQAYKGVLDSKRPGNLEWMVVRIKDPARPGPNDEEIQGRYGFYFDYDEPGGRWVLRKPFETGPDDGTYTHWQQTDLAGRAFRGRSSKLTYQWIRQAVDQAQAKPEASQSGRSRDEQTNG